jgi:hypothetical protein
MIILDASQADHVRGPTGPASAIMPIALADGLTWVLPEAILNDPAHAVHHAYLAALPTREVLPEEFPQPEE